MCWLIHKFEDQFYGYERVKDVNTHWFGSVSILIYSPSNIICGANFLDQVDSAYKRSCVLYKGRGISSAPPPPRPVAIAMGYSTVRQE